MGTKPSGLKKPHPGIIEQSPCCCCGIGIILRIGRLIVIIVIVMVVSRIFSMMMMVSRVRGDQMAAVHHAIQSVCGTSVNAK
jgi:hypothetical protein